MAGGFSSHSTTLHPSINIPEGESDAMDKLLIVCNDPEKHRLAQENLREDNQGEEN
jgi:hypothetical protein